MSVGAIEAGRAFVRLLVNDEALQKGLKSAQAKLKTFASTTGTLGRQLLGMSAAMGAPLIAGAKAFADFETQMAQVSTMLEDPSQFMGQFSEGIKKMAVEFGEGTDTLAKGLYDILSAAIAPAKAMDVLETSVKAAKAGLSDTGTAANAIVTILNAYQLQADQAGKVSDWLFQVIKRGQTTFEEFAPNVGNMATIAATAGVSLDELGALFATITRNGVQTEEAITAINSILSTFLSPSEEAAELAKQLGFNLSSATIQTEGLRGAFEKIAGLPPDVIAKLFPNIRALKGVLPALRNLEGFGDDMAALGNAAGSTDEAYKKIAKTVKEQFKKVREAVSQVAIEIGAALKVNLAEGAVTIKEIASAVADWIKKHQDLVLVLGKSTIVVAAVAGGLLALSAAATGASAALGLVGAASTVLHATLAALALNPVVAMFVAVTAAAGTLAYVLGELSTANIAVNNAQKDMLAASDKQRQADAQAMQRLQALATKQKLSANETKEAAAIIERLEKAYGDLGLSIDATTGRIDGATDAYSRMSAAMEESVAKQLRASIMEAQTNAQLLEAELSRIRDTWLMNPFAKTKQMDDLSRQMLEQAEIAKLLTKRLQDLKAGKEDALGVSTTGTPATGVADPLAAAAADKKAADFAASLDERLHQARIAMIEDEEQRELEAIRRKHEAEMAAAKEAGQDTEGLARVQEAEIGVIEEEHRRRREEEDKRAQEEKTRNQRQMAEDIEDLEIQRDYTGTERELRQIEAQRRRALADADAMGQSVEQINRLYDLQSQIARAGQSLPELDRRTSIAGTFSAQMAARMGGSNAVDKQIADNTKKTADGVAKTARILEAGMSLI